MSNVKFVALNVFWGAAAGIIAGSYAITKNKKGVMLALLTYLLVFWFINKKRKTEQSLTQ